MRQRQARARRRLLPWRQGSDKGGQPGDHHTIQLYPGWVPLPYSDKLMIPTSCAILDLEHWSTLPVDIGYVEDGLGRPLDSRSSAVPLKRTASKKIIECSACLEYQKREAGKFQSNPVIVARNRTK